MPKVFRIAVGVAPKPSRNLWAIAAKGIMWRRRLTRSRDRSGFENRRSNVASGVRTLSLAALLAWTGVASAAPADDLSKGVPSKQALQRKTALKLAGLATFVATSCRELKLDNDRFKKAVEALGVTTHDLEEQKAQFAYLNYTMMYKQNIPENCARAQAEFGPGGKTLPGLFQVVATPPQPPAPAPAAKAPEGPMPDSKKP